MLSARVGVAPGTTTLRLGDGQLGIQCFPVPPPNRAGVTPPQLPSLPTTVAVETPTWRFMVPYENMTDMKGLGIINETDRWMTGTPNRLPGTVVLRIPGRADAFPLSGLGIGPDDLLPPSDEPATVTMRAGVAAGLGVGALLLGTVVGYIVGRRR